MFAEYRPTTNDAQFLKSPRRHFKVMRGLRGSEIDRIFFVRFQLTLASYLCLRAMMTCHRPAAEYKKRQCTEVANLMRMLSPCIKMKLAPWAELWC